MSDNALDERVAEAAEVFEKDVGVWDVEMETRPGPGAAPVPRGLSKEIMTTTCRARCRS